MFVCLSSGARPRYRQDVLRAIAIPSGGPLQFRYAQDYITESLKSKIRDGAYQGSKAIIAYVDQTGRDHDPLLIPCRFGRVTKAQLHGTTATLEFVLGQHAYAQDLSAFNKQIRSMSGGALPAWKGSEEQYPKGAYALEVPDEAMSSVVATDELNYWEKIVGQLANRPDFKDESCFYMVDGLYDVEKDEAHEIRNGVYDLKPSHEYELRIYHYLPTSPTKTVYLHLRASKPSVEFMSNPVQVIDSRYDMKRIRFRTGLPTCKKSVFIHCSVVAAIRTTRRIHSILT